MTSNALTITVHFSDPQGGQLRHSSNYTGKCLQEIWVTSISTMRSFPKKAKKSDSELAFDKDKIGFVGLNSEISIRFKYKKNFLTIKTKLTLTTLKQKG